MKTITKEQFDQADKLTFRQNNEARCYLAHKEKDHWRIEGALTADDVITQGMNITYVPYLNLNLHMFSVEEIRYRDHKGDNDLRHFTAKCDLVQVLYPKKGNK